MFFVLAPLLVKLGFASWAEAVFTVAMIAPAVFFLGCAVYLFLLLACAAKGRSQLILLSPQNTGQPSVPDSRSEPGAVESLEGNLPRFVLLIPAHNEELVLGDALDSLNRMDYPRDAFDIVVIADNCNDRTAEIARSKGAIAQERFDQVSIGKGYALEWALNRLLCTEQNPHSDRLSAGLVDPTAADMPARARDFDAVVVLDADTLVAPNLLAAFASRLKVGDRALQARYEVLNPDESWRTRLMTCALALAHIVKPLGREILGLSDGLKGNGMCFAREVVERVPWSGESITEDIEYTLRLCRAGYRVSFVPGTAVWAQMPTTGEQSVSQRKRWEGGRYRLLREVVPSLLWDGVRTRSRVLCDRALELIIPPFAEMFAVPVIMLGICLTAALLFHWHWAFALSAAWCAILLLQAGYLFGGMWAAKIPGSIAMTALYAPGYIVWKFGVYGAMLLRRSAGGWKRTERRKMNG